jgi:hypothetical protein
MELGGVTEEERRGKGKGAAQSVEAMLGPHYWKLHLKEGREEGNGYKGIGIGIGTNQVLFLTVPEAREQPEVQLSEGEDLWETVQRAAVALKWTRRRMGPLDGLVVKWRA